MTRIRNEATEWNRPLPYFESTYNVDFELAADGRMLVTFHGRTYSVTTKRAQTLCNALERGDCDPYGFLEDRWGYEPIATR